MLVLDQRAGMVIERRTTVGSSSVGPGMGIISGGRAAMVIPGMGGSPAEASCR